MSYNIDSVEYIGKGRLHMDLATARKLIHQYKDTLPESTFFDYVGNDDTQGDFILDPPWWQGSSSGHAYEDILPDILQHTKGHAKLLFIWEGGDSKTGLEVKEGKVKKCKVKVSLT